MILVAGNDSISNEATEDLGKTVEGEPYAYQN